MPHGLCLAVHSQGNTLYFTKKNRDKIKVHRLNLIFIEFVVGINGQKFFSLIFFQPPTSHLILDNHCY